MNGKPIGSIIMFPNGRQASTDRAPEEIASAMARAETYCFERQHIRLWNKWRKSTPSRFIWFWIGAFAAMVLHG